MMTAMRITMYAMLFLLPLITAIIGIAGKKNPPKTINRIKGYRTTLSMASQAAWDYANVRYAELCIKYSVYSLIFAALVIVVCVIAKIDSLSIAFSVLIVVVMIIQTVIIMLPIKTVEKELKDEVYKR